MLADFILKLSANGRSSFSFDDVKKLKSSTPMAIKAGLHRLQKKGEIAMPYRGFYVIVSPEYRSAGCIPPEQFIPDLMEYLGEVYYTGLLSAGEYHGAAHHRPQVFQVMVAKRRRPIKCGKMRVEFIFRKNAAKIPTQQRNTRAGILKIATPEATALDLIGYVRHCAGLDNVATVLTELAEKIDADHLLKVAKLSPIAWVQRLGYLLDLIGEQKKAEVLARYIKTKQPVRSPLMPNLSIKGAKLDSRWKIFVNAQVESEV
ncbi:MAG: type IV toxin-antitoxin system AbiEi family antitoxin [Candidatus Schekmanbacteria bacterium]|nr:type IV toxin-antitoxin system AbiEi family antitoxin [Candidatus Schekmanbacteria bacterium]